MRGGWREKQGKHCRAVWTCLGAYTLHGCCYWTGTFKKVSPPTLKIFKQYQDTLATGILFWILYNVTWVFMIVPTNLKAKIFLRADILGQMIVPVSNRFIYLSDISIYNGHLCVKKS